MSSILVRREYQWLPSLYLCLAQVLTYSSSYRACLDYLLLAGLVWEKNTVPGWKFTIVYEQANRLIFSVQLHQVHSCVHWKMRVSSIFETKFESYKVKYFGLEGVPMVTIPVPLFSSSTCVVAGKWECHVFWNKIWML